MTSRFSRLDRLPPYVFATVNQIKMQARRDGQDIIDLGMGNPDLGPPPHIVDKLIEAARKPHNHRYSASMGITKLRLAITNWYQRRFDVDLDPDSEAIVTIGVKEGLCIWCSSASGRGMWCSPPTRRTRSIRTRRSSPVETCGGYRSAPGRTFLKT